MMRRVRGVVTLTAMRIGSSLFLIAVGAILYFAVTATVAGIDIQIVGLIFMIIGVIGFVLTLFLANRASDPAARREYY
jgi:tetrahydromethanopterin S-methyltransferase subunit E